MREDSAMETDADVSLANLGPMLNVLSPRGGWGGSEAAVSAEAARPEATHMLVQNGQDGAVWGGADAAVPAEAARPEATIYWCEAGSCGCVCRGCVFSGTPHPSTGAMRANPLYGYA
eukprot:scaffold3090_cov23-Tisochrysis_lutea.AAC.3